NMTQMLDNIVRNNQGAQIQNMGSAPYIPPLGMPTGTQVGSASPGMQASMNGAPQVQLSGRAPGQTIEDLLIKLITNTIAPQSWSDVGGQGTIQYFPLGLALVVNQTPDIQEQIADLLAALRRLQDLEVAIELRLISVSEAFFERIGVDFDINITTKN